MYDLADLDHGRTWLVKLYGAQGLQGLWKEFNVVQKSTFVVQPDIGRKELEEFKPKQG
jgi:peroxiredoxin